MNEKKEIVQHGLGFVKEVHQGQLVDGLVARNAKPKNFSGSGVYHHKAPTIGELARVGAVALGSAIAIKGMEKSHDQPVRQTGHGSVLPPYRAQAPKWPPSKSPVFQIPIPQTPKSNLMKPEKRIFP